VAGLEPEGVEYWAGGLPGLDGTSYLALDGSYDTDAPDGDGDGVAADWLPAGEVGTRGVPHLLQKRAASGTDAPQLLQNFGM